MPEWWNTGGKKNKEEQKLIFNKQEVDFVGYGELIISWPSSVIADVEDRFVKIEDRLSSGPALQAGLSSAELH